MQLLNPTQDGQDNHWESEAKEALPKVEADNRSEMHKRDAAQPISRQDPCMGPINGALERMPA